MPHVSPPLRDVGTTDLHPVYGFCRGRSRPAPPTLSQKQMPTSRPESPAPPTQERTALRSAKPCAGAVRGCAGGDRRSRNAKERSDTRGPARASRQRQQIRRLHSTTRCNHCPSPCLRDSVVEMLLGLLLGAGPTLPKPSRNRLPHASRFSKRGHPCRLRRGFFSSRHGNAGTFPKVFPDRKLSVPTQRANRPAQREALRFGSSRSEGVPAAARNPPLSFNNGFLRVSVPPW